MDNQIYREKSIEQLSAPEQLNDYLRVTGPGVWFLLTGIIVLLAGILIWGTFGKIVTTVAVPVQIRDGTASCYVLAEDISDTDIPLTVTIGDMQMQTDPEDTKTLTLDASADPELFSSGYLSPGRNVAVLSCSTALEDGFYEGTVTTETLKPISLLFSKT